jgi:putative heme iron utilization protein
MNDEPESIQKSIGKLIDSLKSVQLATINKQAEAEISYTPFVLHDSHYYIFISELATHTENIMLNQKLSILFIEDERSSQNIFKRKRMSLKCTSKEISRDSDRWHQTMQAFQTRQGNTVKLLQTLPDFHLFELSPSQGTFIQGFGQAFSLSGERLQTIKAIEK